MKILIGPIAAILLPQFAGATALDLLGLDATSSTRTFHSATRGGVVDENIHTYRSTRPGIRWDFDFAFKKSTDKFKWKIDVVVVNKVPQEAGHNHGNSQPELFYYPNWPDKTIARLDNITVHSPLLDQDQTFTIYLATVNYAEQLIAYGSYTTAYNGVILYSTLTQTLDIKTPGLEQLPKNDTLYKSYGWTLSHPYSHYGTTTTITALKNLASGWKNISTGAQVLEFGNISLPWGGVLDVDNDWKSQNLSHAFGIAADVGKRNFSNNERAALIKLLCNSGFYVYNTNEGMKDHYHIVHKKELARFKALKWPAEFSSEANETVIACCTAKPGTLDYQRCTGFKKSE
ncbi:MAG: hypothetical protein WCK76_00635 [Elusimicrobiota bacterium]